MVYIYNVYLFNVCLYFFLFKLLSKQKNQNLEISVLGQLCPGSLATITLQDPRTLRLLNAKHKVCLMLSKPCFLLSLLEEFCMYKGWKVSLGRFISSEKQYQNCNQVNWLFSCKTSYEWAFCFWKLDFRSWRLCMYVCRYVCRCVCIMRMCACVSSAMVLQTLFMKMGPIQRVNETWEKGRREKKEGDIPGYISSQL